MPMPFQKAVTTEKGTELLNRSQAGEGVITFVAIATGNGVYSETEKSHESLKKSTNLKTSKNFYKISDIRKEGMNSVKVTAVIGNQDPVTKEAVVTEGYNINEIGLFAKIEGDSENTLLSIAVTSGEHGDFLPAFTGKETAQIIQNYIVSISNDLEISLKYSDGAVAFKSDVDKQLADFKAEISAEQDSLNKTLKETIGNSINGIDGKVTEILNKLIALENAIYYDITGNSWRLSFTNLEGVKVTKGNYNSAKKRIEC